MNYKPNIACIEEGESEIKDISRVQRIQEYSGTVAFILRVQNEQDSDAKPAYVMLPDNFKRWHKITFR